MAAAFRNKLLSGFMLGHFTNDLFMGVLTALLPILKSEFGLSNAQIGLIALVQAGSGSLFQPVFGLLADRFRIRFLVPGIILWDSLCVAGFGFARDTDHLVICAFLLGIGSAAFHPYGASGAAHAAEPDLLNSSLSYYTVAGTAGYAIGPLVATLFIAVFGQHGTIYFIPIGIVGASLIAWQTVHGTSHDYARHRSANPADGDVEWAKLSAIIGIVMLRSWTYLALISLLPIHYKELGFRLGFYNSLPTVMILAGGVGTLIGGSMADRIPGRKIIVWTQLLSIIPALAAARVDSSSVIIFLILFGMLSDSSLSLTLIAAQRLLPGRTGLASGVILGLGFVAGSIGVPITGALADRTSIPFALSCTAFLALGAVALTLILPASVFNFARRAPPPPLGTAEATP